MTKMLIVRNESKNWIIVTTDINREVVPITKAKIVFTVKDRDKNTVIIKKNFLIEEEEEKHKGISFYSDGLDGKIKVSISSLDTVNLEPGYYDYYLIVSIGKINFAPITDEFIILPNNKEEKEDSDDNKDNKEDSEPVITMFDDEDDILSYCKKIEKKYFLDV